MARLIVLDSTPLGLLCGPLSSAASQRCRAWLAERVDAGEEVAVPEIADYEIRRELHHREREASMARLDRLCLTSLYLPITTDAMRMAAFMWGMLRQQGRPTADRHALDADVILAAQAACAGVGFAEVIIATSNVGHLARFGIAALPWESIV